MNVNNLESQIISEANMFLSDIALKDNELGSQMATRANKLLQKYSGMLMCYTHLLLTIESHKRILLGI